MEIPDGFAVIETGLYRARSAPEYTFPFLISLGLKTIIVLDTATPSRSLSDFAKQQNIELLYLVTESWRSIHDAQQSRHTAAIMSKALKYILNNEKYPLMIVGSNLLTGVVRKLENWSLFAVLRDYNTYSEVSGVRTNSPGSVFLEFLDFAYGSTDEANTIYNTPDSSNPLPYVVFIDLPPPELRPDWVRRFGIDDKKH